MNNKMAGSLEVHASSMKDSLISGMSFGSNSGTASYILNRRSVSFPPQSGGTFEPGVLKIIRFSLQDATDGGASGWIDGSTMRLAFVFHNKSRGPTYFNPDQPISLFRRCRVLVGGVEAHDIQDYGRVVSMFSYLLPPSRRMNDVIEGFGSTTQGLDPTLRSTLSAPKIKFGIDANEYRRVLSQILAPFLTSSGRLIPVALAGGVVIELELDTYEMCFSIEDGHQIQWETVQPMILVDTVRIDPALSSSYARHLLEGKSLPISYHNFFSMQATLTDKNSFSLPIQRGFSRLSAIYLTFGNRELPV